MTLYLGNNLISGTQTLVGESRNIGQIIPSAIPLQDAGLHLLDGALIRGGGIYSAFVDYIAGLVTDYPNLFVTESAWQSAVTTYGVCGKFVYDSVANTVRLPKITGIIEGTTDVTALGDLVQAGLPNITGSLNKSSGVDALMQATPSQITQTGAINVTQYQSKAYFQTINSSNMLMGFDFDASRSNSIYGNSSTVQPQAIKVLYYIVLATSTKTDIEVDIDEIATDLNGKADVDLTNITNTASTKMATSSLPSSTYINLTLGASGTTYTAPADGWFCISKNITTAQYLVLTELTTGRSVGNQFSANGYALILELPVLKGTIVRADYNAAGVTGYFRFYYAEGSKWEAQ